MTQQIETFGDAMRDLERRFPDHKREIDAWSDGYFRKLGHLAPKALRGAYLETLDAWKYQRPPKPADFGQHAPKVQKLPPVRSRQPIVDLVDGTLQRYAEDIERLAADIGVSVYRIILELKTHLERPAWEASRQRSLPAYLTMTTEDWARIRGRATPKPPGYFPWESGGARTAASAINTTPDPIREARRKAQIERAERLSAEWHADQGHELTPQERKHVEPVDDMPF